MKPSERIEQIWEGMTNIPDVGGLSLLNKVAAVGAYLDEQHAERESLTYGRHGRRAFVEMLIKIAAADGDDPIDEMLNDCSRIAEALTFLQGYTVTQVEAYIFWTWVSEKYSSGFLILPKSLEDLRVYVKKWLRNLEDEP